MLNKEEIIEALSPLNFWGKKQNTGIDRDKYLPCFNRYLKGRDVVIAVIGVRRSGKTFLTKQILKGVLSRTSPENTLYVLLEDPKLEPYLGVNLLDEIYYSFKNYVAADGELCIVLDEIQNVPLWEKWVRLVIEKRENVRLIITGSSSKLLYSRLAKTLTGRTLTIEVFPLSFKEFLLFKGFTLGKEYALISERRKLEKFLFEYLTYGGFPQVVLEEDIALKNQLLKELFEGIVYKDVMGRHKTKDAPLAKIIAEISLNYFSSLGSASKLRNIVAGLVGRKVSPNLVLQILSYLEEAFLIYQVPIFSYKVKEQKLYPKKFYCIDTGIINAVTTKFSENIGRLYENTVAISLIRQNGKDKVFYWKSNTHEEVDFVIKEGLKIKKLIQVCYELSNEKTKKRELASLVKASKELKCKQLLIITRDYAGAEKIGSQVIVYVPLWKWLLENE